MRLFATKHARAMLLDVLSASSSLSLATAKPFDNYDKRSQEYAERFSRLESYIAGLENGARCAYDALVADAKSCIAHRFNCAAIGLERSELLDRSDVRHIRETARRAREIAQAFKVEGIAAWRRSA